MKFLHTSDLHIGKTVNEFSMLEDQKYILTQLLTIAKKEAVDAVVIAGDVYDRSIPSTDAVTLLDEFLTSLLKEGIKVLLISGNHDSPERVGFADKILEKQGLFIGGSVENGLKQVVFEDKFGKVTFLLLPFVKPAVMGAATSQEAVEKLLAESSGCREQKQKDRKNDRHVLVTHFFVTGKGGESPKLSDSETRVNVGGLEYVTSDTFSGFDYVALGHIHKPQKIGEGNCYYAGSPLKYSFSECHQVKCVNLVTIEKEVQLQQIPLTPLHEMRKIKGKLNDLIQPEVVQAANHQDYIQAILTDEEELIDPIGVLRSVYPNVMQIQLQKNEQKKEASYETSLHVDKKSTIELFKEFYELVREQPLDEMREQIVIESLKQAEKGEPV